MYKSILLILVFISTNIYAIVDIERIRYQSPNKTHFFSLKGGISGKKGSSDKENYTLSSFYKFFHQQHEFFINGSYDYEKGNGVLISKDRLLHLRYTYQFLEHHALENYYQYSKAPFSTIFFRELIGANYRHTLTQKIKLGIGLFHETQESSYAKRNLLRLNSYISFFYKISESASLTLSAYLQPAIEELSDINGTLKSELESKINSHFSILYLLQADRISKQSAGIIKNDTSYAASFVYYWK